jgi:hypothetical protein
MQILGHLLPFSLDEIYSNDTKTMKGKTAESSLSQDSSWKPYCILHAHALTVKQRATKINKKPYPFKYHL